MSEPQPRSGVVRPLLLAVAGAVVLGGAVYYAIHSADQGTAPASPGAAGPAVSATAPAGAQAQAKVAAKPIPPSFDIVRINKAGDAVMAGRASPGAKVTISAGGAVVGSATADQAGQWVFVPSTPLGPGGHQLTLAARLPDGTALPGKGSVLLVVPAAGAELAANPAPGAAGPLAVLATPSGPEVMQGGAPVGKAGIGIGALEYGADGQMQITGTAPPGAKLRLSLDGRNLGDVAADGAGHWHLTSPLEAPPGDHRLHVARIAPDGAVLAQVARDFPRPLPGEAAPASGQIIVRRGQSLWLIARRTYGAGIRYTVIFRANRGQIHDPNLIYPGQAFTLPAETPSSSSRSR